MVILKNFGVFWVFFGGFLAKMVQILAQSIIKGGKFAIK